MLVYDHQQEQIKQRQMRESFEKKKDKEHF
jgi:hypothetical protein